MAATCKRKDDDFHMYSIPEFLVGEFDKLLEIAQNAPFMSSTKWDAEDLLNEKFSKYRI
jgi:hypothetical protein